MNGLNIAAANPYIYHYWNLKEFRTLLDDFFVRYKHLGVEELSDLAATLHPHKMVVDKMRFEKANFARKLLMKIFGGAWSIGKYKL